MLAGKFTAGEVSGVKFRSVSAGENSPGTHARLVSRRPV